MVDQIQQLYFYEVCRCGAQSVFAAHLLVHYFCSCYLLEQALSFPASHLMPSACCLCLVSVCCIEVCFCSVMQCCGSLKHSMHPMHPQLLSLDNLVSTVSNGGHNHCVGFPSGQRWSVWPGRRLALACFCPELATKPRRGEAGLPK